ncbi:MAG: hypothetical protein KatS3mg108_1477 [Isosphaeraceae bacterium]|jgi:hypothetical protein|nr:MAG: hypothetical protein KatS3mg108_1477 [Isosphaeraceae bacterium]
MRWAVVNWVAAWSLGVTATLGAGVGDRPFGIRVVDEATGRGVPLVVLRTTNEIRFVTDSAGWVAFDEPGLLGQEVFFFVEGDGYAFPKDGFGMQGTILKTEPGGRAELKVRRMNVAERLYRITGAGRYADSVRLGEPVADPQPLLNGQVMGQDSIQSAIYGGRVYWFWGDTSRPRYPLGLFHMAGATTPLPGSDAWDPEQAVPLRYFVGPDGFARGTCVMEGDGPTWASGLTVLKDATGRERMFASYVKIRGFLEAYRRGLAEWDDRAETFRHVAEIPVDAAPRPDGHPFEYEDGGVRYVVFANPYALARVEATAEAWLDLGRYEGWSCLRPGGTMSQAELERGPDGRLIWGWKRATAPVGPAEQAELIRRGVMRPEEAWFRLVDAETGEPVQLHSGSMAWNAYRKRWIVIGVETGGKPSPLGEVWYAEARRPEGPWERGRKIVSHAEYSFYNPKHHPFLDREGGRVIYFEGTYTALFSKARVATPRYDYNQIMYRLDLDDPRLAEVRAE